MARPSAGLDGLVRNIGIISRNNSVLASMLSHLAAGDEPTEPRELRVLLQDTGLIAKETGELLLSLQQDVSHDAGAAPDRQRSMLNKLNKDFQFVLRRFQQLAQQASQHARRRQVDRRQGGSSQGTFSDPNEEPLYDEQHGLLEAERVQHETQLKLQKEAAAQATLHTVEERERMIKQVETTVGEVNEIFVDLAGLVNSQGEHIDHISTAIEKTAAQTHHAAEELRTASATRQRVRSRTCCLYLGVVLAGSVLLLIITSQMRT